MAILMTLEEEVMRGLIQFDISPSKVEFIISNLENLRKVCPGDYRHSLNVNLLANSYIEKYGLNRADDFTTGLSVGSLTHDIGKLGIPPHILNKTYDPTSNYTDEDMKIMKSHVEATYKILQPKFKIAAGMSVRHHSFQNGRSYPRELPVPDKPFSEEEKLKIENGGYLIHVFDTYEAATHRPNRKISNSPMIFTPDEAIRMMIEEHPERKELINDLYKKGVLNGHGNGRTSYGFFVDHSNNN